jgi:hypothetical protein
MCCVAVNCVLPSVVTDHSHSLFFIDQLQAFDVWLKYGVEHQKAPQQLPVVLQVLLSQVSVACVS